jgi:hypothetical protein
MRAVGQPGRSKNHCRHWRNAVQEFISEDDLQTFEGWMRYQAIDTSTMAAVELTTWRRLFEEARQRWATIPKVGLMKLQPVPGEHRYAVAVQEGADLWLTLWVRRSRKGEFFIMLPRGGRDWDAHELPPRRYHAHEELWT